MSNSREGRLGQFTRFSRIWKLSAMNRTSASGNVHELRREEVAQAMQDVSDPAAGGRTEI
jgi:hypothetical protein